MEAGQRNLRRQYHTTVNDNDIPDELDLDSRPHYLQSLHHLTKHTTVHIFPRHASGADGELGAPVTVHSVPGEHHALLGLSLVHGAVLQVGNKRVASYPIVPVIVSREHALPRLVLTFHLQKGGVDEGGTAFPCTQQLELLAQSSGGTQLYVNPSSDAPFPGQVKEGQGGGRVQKFKKFAVLGIRKDKMKIMFMKTCTEHREHFKIV